MGYQTVQVVQSLATYEAVSSRLFLLISTISGLKGQVATPRSLADDILNDDQQRAKLNDVLTRFEGECVELGLAACPCDCSQAQGNIGSREGQQSTAIFFRR